MMINNSGLPFGPPCILCFPNDGQWYVIDRFYGDNRRLALALK